MSLLVLTVVALAAAAWWLPVSSWSGAVADLGPAAPVAGVVLGAALLVALVPRTPVSLACGLLFGPFTGAACALLVAIAAAAITFAAGRWLGRDFVARHAGHRWNRLESWITRDGILAVAAVRTIPLGPYGLAGYAYGSSGVRARDYALGTFIAAAPSAVTYALLGAAVASPGPVSPLTLVPVAFGLALSVAVLLRARRRARRTAFPPTAFTPTTPSAAATSLTAGPAPAPPARPL
jgi:uncharacterized membrane protein YdjX (TVP38/TMEM64 family)